MIKPWAKGTVIQVRGVHCVRLDSNTHEKAKQIAERLGLTIKDVIVFEP